MAAWKDGTALFVCVLVVVLETAVFRRFAAARAAAAPGIVHEILNIDQALIMKATHIRLNKNNIKMCD